MGTIEQEKNPKVIMEKLMEHGRREVIECRKRILTRKNELEAEIQERPGSEIHLLGLKKVEEDVESVESNIEAGKTE